jgi:cytochrome b6-f complex iron-sulfur subunit
MYYLYSFHPEFPDGNYIVFSTGGFMQNDGRRKFLGSCLCGLAVVTAGAIVYPLFQYLAPEKSKGPKGKIRIPEKEIAVGDAKFFDFGGETAVIVRTGDTSLIALSAVCTHLGCIVQWQKDKQHFLCPCHAGQYKASGEVIAGPPPRPLAKLPFTIADGIIIVG